MTEINPKTLATFMERQGWQLSKTGQWYSKNGKLFLSVEAGKAWYITIQQVLRLVEHDEKCQLESEIEIEGCQAMHADDTCLHCNISPCPHCKQWGGMQRTEIAKCTCGADQINAVLRERRKECGVDNETN